jgi:hypothetical protein
LASIEVSVSSLPATRATRRFSALPPRACSSAARHAAWVAILRPLGRTTLSATTTSPGRKTGARPVARPKLTSPTTPSWRSRSAPARARRALPPLT